LGFDALDSPNTFPYGASVLTVIVKNVDDWLFSSASVKSTHGFIESNTVAFILLREEGEKGS
jgi:hypothetical protein